MAEAPALVCMSEPLILTIDNGGTNTRITQYSDEQLGGIDGYRTPKNYDQAIGEISVRARHILRGRKPDAIGFSLAGKVQNGRIVQAGELQKNGWVDLPFVEDVASELGMSPDDIVALNDCAAGANAERQARRLPAGKTGVFMVLSTGFGGALYNQTGITSDEPGHYFLKPGALCGDGADGHIEGFVSGSGIARNYGISGEDLPHDHPYWQEIKCNLADGMHLTLKRYESNGTPLTVVGFTGAVAIGGPNILPDLQTTLTSKLGAAAPQITTAIYGEQSGLYGAAFAATDRLFEQNM